MRSHGTPIVHVATAEVGHHQRGEADLHHIPGGAGVLVEHPHREVEEALHPEADAVVDMAGGGAVGATPATAVGAGAGAQAETVVGAEDEQTGEG